MSWCCGGEAEEETHRRVGFQGPPNDMGERTNWIKVAKYWTYIDLFIVFTFFDFFVQAANFYFVIIGILQMIREISTTQQVPVTYFPLTFVYLVSLAREFYEEYLRRVEQSTTNG